MPHNLPLMMDTSVRPILTALAALTDDELRALIATVSDRAQTTPGLLAWVEYAADWEQHRRSGLNNPLQPPNAAIPRDEDDGSIAVAVALREQFVWLPNASALFAAILSALNGQMTRH
jgi:hypothetical protein